MFPTSSTKQELDNPTLIPILVATQLPYLTNRIYAHLSTKKPAMSGDNAEIYYTFPLNRTGQIKTVSTSNVKDI